MNEKIGQFDEKDTKDILRRYNICNVIRALAGDRTAGGYEREISDGVADFCGRSAQGFFIPNCVLCRNIVAGDPTNKGTTGANTIAEDLIVDEFIEALMAKTVLGKAGMRTLGGLRGDIAVPKGGAADAYWISTEGGNATEVTPEFGQVKGTPRTIGAYCDFTRKMALQTSLAVQRFALDCISRGVRRGVEAAIFNGSGTSGQPTGLANTTGIGSSSMIPGTATKADMVEMWQLVATANADGDNMAYIGSPAVKGLLAKTLDITTIDNGKSGDDKATVGGVTAAHYLCENGKVEDYPFLMSNLCGAKKLWFGDWSQIILAAWSGIDLIVDPYSLGKSGSIRCVALQDCDVLIRHPEAFVVGQAIAD